ncbi:hypothetical protein [Algoriphagus halophilus]|uniref:AAA domain-containing protein n=1 Tax=Algoriphagus halophilus TaxID=226505 RepID=A0A1N6D9J7_9BACT|nr:hypothetical protein [Algoriphagus halophilus]SIN67363.1 AAA domain-containing protein [Algoriphagus halophilus]
MIKNKDIFLKELANEPELQKNTVSLVFALNSNIDISKKEKFVEYVLPFYERLKETKREALEIIETDETEIIERYRNKDFRIKDVKLSAIRGFPKSNKPFGIDFCNERAEPQSMILLGTNGSGKSSIYEAIEYTFCRRVGEAELRTFKDCIDNDKWFENYLAHFNYGFSESICRININQSDFKPFNIHEESIPSIVRQKVNPDTHFISDFDIYYKGRLDYENGNDKSFHYTIAKSLGLTELLEFEKNIKSFIYYKRQTESRRITALQKENKSSKESIETSKKALIEKNNLLDSVLKKQKNNDDEKKVRDLFEMLNTLKQNYFSFNFEFDDFIFKIATYRESYKEFIAIKVKGDYKESQFLSMGLELLKESENCPFCRNSKDEIDAISLNVKTRIEKIESLNKVTQKLNNSFNQITEQLSNLINQINLARNKINEETKTLKDKVDFLELLEIENKFLSNISSLVGSDMFSEGQNLEENPNYIKDKFSFLFNYLKSNTDFINNQLFNYVVNDIPALFERRNVIISNIEKKISEKSQNQSISEQSIELKKDIHDLNIKIVNFEKDIVKNESEIMSLQQELARFDTIKSETAAYLEFYHKKLNNEVEKAFAPIKLIVEEILEYYFTTMDNRDVHIEISKRPETVDEETGEVLSEIITAYAIPKDKTIQPLPVKKYLNTFHYRLFSTMVGISIAIASRINTGINLPLVLDDIFYASDFKNKTTVQNFIKSLFKIFEDFTPNLPLQLILFTHDELVFESAINAAAENQVNDISFSRLFPHFDSKEKNDYLNIIYKIPTYLPQKIYNKFY